jgi:hypothetical protein
MKKALIVWGGWDGHEPQQVADIFATFLRDENFEVEISDTLDSFLDADKINALDLIVPIWTMGKITHEQLQTVVEAVAGGVGMAGCHGGMCDAFRDAVEWAFMTGGTWVSHPGGDGVEYMVNVQPSANPLVEGIDDFMVKSEQYYLHVDPAVEVLATTRFPQANWYHSANGVVDMPVVWTKRWGLGRVYYNSLGHHADIVAMPQVGELMRRGCLWAADGKSAAQARGLTKNIYTSTEKMF